MKIENDINPAHKFTTYHSSDSSQWTSKIPQDKIINYLNIFVNTGISKYLNVTNWENRIIDKSKNVYIYLATTNDLEDIEIRLSDNSLMIKITSGLSGKILSFLEFLSEKLGTTFLQ